MQHEPLTAEHSQLRVLILDALESERNGTALLDALLDGIDAEKDAAAPSREERAQAVLAARDARRHWQAGRAKVGILLWLLGVPLPIILLIWMVKGCV